MVPLSLHLSLKLYSTGLSLAIHMGRLICALLVESIFLTELILPSSLILSDHHARSNF